MSLWIVVCLAAATLVSSSLHGRSAAHRFGMSEEEFASLERLFDAADTNHDKRIGIDEYDVAMAHLSSFTFSVKVGAWDLSTNESTLYRNSEKSHFTFDLNAVAKLVQETDLTNQFKGADINNDNKVELNEAIKVAEKLNMPAKVAYDTWELFGDPSAKASLFDMFLERILVTYGNRMARLHNKEYLENQLGRYVPKNFLHNIWKYRNFKPDISEASVVLGFEKADTNGDGVVDRSEYLASLTAVQLPIGVIAGAWSLTSDGESIIQENSTFVLTKSALLQFVQSKSIIDTFLKLDADDDGFVSVNGNGVYDYDDAEFGRKIFKSIIDTFLKLDVDDDGFVYDDAKFAWRYFSLFPTTHDMSLYEYMIIRAVIDQGFTKILKTLKLEGYPKLRVSELVHETFREYLPLEINIYLLKIMRQVIEKHYHESPSYSDEESSNTSFDEDTSYSATTQFPDVTETPSYSDEESSNTSSDETTSYSTTTEGPDVIEGPSYSDEESNSNENSNENTSYSASTIDPFSSESINSTPSSLEVIPGPAKLHSLMKRLLQAVRRVKHDRRHRNHWRD